MFPALNNSLRNLRDSKTPQDLFKSICADTTLGVNEQVVHVTGFSAAVAVTLPPVSEAVGRAYIIKVLDDASINNITIQDQNDSRNWADIVVNQAAGASVVLFCTGEDYIVLGVKGVVKLTDSSGGTSDGTVAAVVGSGADATINNNFADLSVKVNEILELLGQ